MTVDVHLPDLSFVRKIEESFISTVVFTIQSTHGFTIMGS